MRTLTLVAVLVAAGCGTPSNVKSEGGAPAVNADPKGNLEKIHAAWRRYQDRIGKAPQKDDPLFDKYLKEFGDPKEITKGLDLNWNRLSLDLRFLTRQDWLREAVAWQKTSNNGKYYVLLGNGRIDLLDEQEIEAAHNILVGQRLEEWKKQREASDKAQPSAPKSEIGDALEGFSDQAKKNALASSKAMIQGQNGPVPVPKESKPEGPEAKQETKSPGRYLRFKRKSYVELANSEGLINLNQTFTAEMWVRFSSPGTQYLIGDESWPKVGAPVPRSAGWVLRTKTGIPGPFNLTVALDKADWWQLDGPARPLSHQWEHVAVSKATDAFHVFWNGRLYASKSCRGVKFTLCPSNLFLGVRKNALADREFNGDIRAFRLSSKPLYQNAFIPPKLFDKTADTLVLLDFSVGRTNEIRDVSGNRHHGTLVGVEWAELHAEDSLSLGK